VAGWRGDARYEALVRAHGTSLLHLGILLTGNRHDAEDVVQDALLAVSSHWPRVNTLAYVRRAVSNKALDLIRRRREFAVAEIPDAAVDDVGLFHHEQDERFFQLVESLPERQRLTLVLRYHAGLDDAEIAAMLDITQETVRSQAHRGLAKLREQLVEEVGA
jgi:RNA polymerase sigma-70 factor (sigma-E family)